MKTAIVILNWNTREYLEKFLPGLLHSIRNVEDAEVVVADNSSSDGSLEYVKENLPEVKVIAFDKNHGYTGGYNKAIAQIMSDDSPEYLVLMNSDVEVQDGWLEPLVRKMESTPDCGACAPKIHSWKDRDKFEYAGAAGGHIDGFGYPFCRGRILDIIEYDYGQYDHITQKIFWGTGACLMVRSSLFMKLGGFDDRFFAHMEEIDLCWRFQLDGYKIYSVPESTVYHVGGGTLPNDSPYKLYLNYRNNLLMLSNNYPRTVALEYIHNGKELYWAAKRGIKAGFKVIMARMFFDDLAAILYLLTFRTKSFMAVVRAHKDYRRMKRRTSKMEVAEYLQDHMDVTINGMYRKSIIIQRILDGHAVFARMHQTDF